jgi:hypothetical protein
MDPKGQAESHRTIANTQSSITPSSMNGACTGRRGLTRIFAATFITAFITYYTCFQWLGIMQAAPSYTGQGYAGNGETVLGGKVPLEAHIISKCPDTRVSSP